MQGRRRASPAGEFDFGNRNKHIRPAFQVACFEKGLLFLGAARAHHGQRIDQRLVWRVVDAVPVDLEMVGLAKSRKVRKTPSRST